MTTQAERDARQKMADGLRDEVREARANWHAARRATNDALRRLTRLETALKVAEEHLWEEE